MTAHAMVCKPARSRVRVGLLWWLLAFVAGCEGVGQTPLRDEAAIPAAPAAETGGGESPAAAPAVAPPSPAQPAAAPAGGSPLTEPEFYRGSGALIGAASLAEVPVSGNGQVSLNFAEADIREVVDIVLGDTLGLSYIIDPQVQGTVLARTSEPLDREDVIPALENILALNGAALRLVDGVYHVVPLQAAARSLARAGTAVPPGARAGGFGVTIIPLRFASAESVHKVAANFVPAERVFQVDPARNLLIFAGTSTEARDLADLVRLFDVDWMAGMSVALIPVEMAEVTDLVTELEQVFGQDAAGPLQGLVRFIPITRMNAILAISPQQIYLDRASLWIKRLDRGEGSVSRRIYVYYVQNSRAADLAEILSQVFESGGSSGGPTFDPNLAPGLSPVDITTPVRRQPAAPAAAAAAQGEAEPGTPREPAAPARYLQEGRVGAVGRGAGIGALVQESGDVRIIADEKNNALVILATASEYRMIEATLRRLDVVPLQVLIEATIAEVALTDDLSYGLQWFFQSGDAAATFSDTGAVASTFPGFSFLFSQTDAQVVLNALTDITDVNVVSSPQLMVLDNQSASLQVGDEVPIITQSQTSTESTSVTNSVQYRDTGVLLEITPRVSAGGVVVLDIVQEVSDAVTTETSSIDSPTITTRRIETTVAVQSGETVALGGLIRDNRTNSETGVPLLSKIPVFGNLFKTTVDEFLRTELLIFITPRVIGSVADARAMTEELRNRMKSIAPLEERVFGQSEALPAAP